MQSSAVAQRAPNILVEVGEVAEANVDQDQFQGPLTSLGAGMVVLYHLRIDLNMM